MIPLFGKKRILPTDSQLSYSQQGEDLILKFLFGWLKIERPSYLDIGAHHPTYLSNTYLLYQSGGKGVCIEPNPELLKPFRQIRKRDKLINAGIGSGKRKHADFYVLNIPTISTFSKREALIYEKYHNAKISRVIKIPLVNVNSVIKENFSTRPNLISLDTEGLDYEILKSLDFENNAPDVFCVETIAYTGPNSLRKSSEIERLLVKNGYFKYADTFINSIYVRKESWQRKSLQKLGANIWGANAK